MTHDPTEGEGASHHGHSHHGHDHAAHGKDHEHDHDHDDGDGHGRGHSHAGHSHGIGGHAHAPADFGRAFQIGIAANLVYVGAEAFYGVAAHSLSLLADAGHNLGDVLGLAVAWVAAVLSKRRPTSRYTYGLRGTSILAALSNAITLLVVTGGIAWEAVRRLIDPEPSGGLTIIVVAAIGILVNGGTALLFMSGRKDDINIQGAFAHMAADALVALGVALGGAVILFTGWVWLDPAISLVVSLVIVLGTWSLLRDSFNLALDAVPPGIDHGGVEEFLKGLPGVERIHDLHIWGMSTTETALTVHLVRPNREVDDGLLRQAAKDLKARFRIDHATFQVECGDGDECHLAAAGTV